MDAEQFWNLSCTAKILTSMMLAKQKEEEGEVIVFLLEVEVFVFSILYSAIFVSQSYVPTKCTVRL